MFKTSKKSIISMIVLSFLMINPVLANPKTLWEFYDSQGLSLPTLSERAVIYDYVRPGEIYTGSAIQNISLLQILLSEPNFDKNDITESETFGGAGGSSQLPQVSADFESSLVSKILATDTSMTLVDSEDRDGNTLSGWYGFTIDISSSKKEYVVANCAGATCSSMLRGISYNDGVSTSTARAFVHGRGADVSITNHPNLVIITNILNGTDGIPDKIYYDDDITIDVTDDGKVLTTLEYVNNLIASGVATSTETVFGGGTIANQNEMATGYYNALDPKFISTRYATSSSDVATTSVVITDTSGKIDHSFLNLDDDFDFTGENSFNATTTMATTTISSLSVDSFTVPYNTASTSAASVGLVNDSIYKAAQTVPSSQIVTTNSTNRNTISESYVKLKETQYNDIPGSINAYFSIYVQSGGTYYAKVYINGVAVSGEYTGTYTGARVSIGATITVATGDLVQIYCKSAGNPYNVDVQDFSLGYIKSFILATNVANGSY